MSDTDWTGDEPRVVLRRAPFSDNPAVGARGQRTQQKILDAALQVFGEQGYHQCSIGRITKLAGCSRVSFYQYFSSKEDLFRHLSGQVARQLRASAEALGVVDASAAGWDELRAWVARHAEIYERYEPVFHVFAEAAESDEVVAGGSARTSERHLELIRSRLADVELPPRRLDPVIALLLETATRSHDSGRILRAAAPDAFSKERIEVALTDVMHRTLYGTRPDVNVHRATGVAPAPIEFGPLMGAALLGDDGEAELTEAGQRTRDALIDAGRAVFVRRGYHQTRVDDIVEAAGLSHGAFYRYFGNKDDLAHAIVAEAMRHVSDAFVDIPTVGPDLEARNRAVRAWLRRYNDANVPETAVIRLWVDATHRDPTLQNDSAAALDWGRRRLAAFLAPRAFGDPEVEAVVMVSLVSAFGARTRSNGEIDAAAHIIDAGFLAG